jgi:hypothetical protein
MRYLRMFRLFYNTSWFLTHLMYLAAIYICVGQLLKYNMHACFHILSESRWIESHYTIFINLYTFPNQYRNDDADNKYNICNIVIHRIWAFLQSDWLNYSPYISSYTASSEKQDGGPKITRVLRSRKRENICFEIIVQGKTLKKIWPVSKIHLLHRN